MTRSRTASLSILLTAFGICIGLLFGGCAGMCKKCSSCTDAPACAASAEKCASCPKASTCPAAAKACATCPKASTCSNSKATCKKACAEGEVVDPVLSALGDMELPAPDRLAEYGYTELFDGKSLEGWAMAGPGEFLLEHGNLVTKDGMGLLWYKEKMFKNFTLVVEWMNTSKTDNSGIFVRFPDPGNDPWVAVNGGYEVQIDDTSAPPASSGSIYSFAPATSLETKGINRWNRYEITVVGQKYTVVVNGQMVCEFTGERALEGYIGLQNHDPTTKVLFRRVAIKEL